MIVVPELKNTPSEIKVLHKFLSRLTGEEFSKIMGTCYYPKFIKHWIDMQIQTGVKKNDISNFTAGFDKEHYSKFKTINNEISVLIIMCIIYYSRIKQYELVKMFYYLLALRFYSNLIHKYFKFCKDDVWEMSLTRISQKHLYKIKGGISNSLMYLAQVELDKQYELLGSDRLSDERIVEVVYALRHRINQSLKSFSNQYYSLSEEIEKGGKGGGISTSEGDEELSNIGLLSEKISISINTYGQVDKLALIKAISSSGIRRDVAIEMITDLSVVDHKAKVKFLIILMHKLIPVQEWCMDSKRNGLVRKILTDTKHINKYSIKAEVLDLIDGFENKYKIKTINKNQLAIFMAHYLTLYVRNRYCK